MWKELGAVTPGVAAAAWAHPSETWAVRWTFALTQSSTDPPKEAFFCCDEPRLAWMLPQHEPISSWWMWEEVTQQLRTEESVSFGWRRDRNYEGKAGWCEGNNCVSGVGMDYYSRGSVRSASLECAWHLRREGKGLWSPEPPERQSELSLIPDTEDLQVSATGQVEHLSWWENSWAKKGTERTACGAGAEHLHETAVVASPC